MMRFLITAGPAFSARRAHKTAVGQTPATTSAFLDDLSAGDPARLDSIGVVHSRGPYPTLPRLWTCLQWAWTVLYHLAAARVWCPNPSSTRVSTTQNVGRNRAVNGSHG